MNLLKDHLILFDADCPICSLYTRALVSSGVIEKEGREAYQDVPPETCPMVDRQRAVNEIALLNLQTGEVSYGIRSLFKVFAAVVPFLGPLFRFAPFVWLMDKLYGFISYNRRVIVPPPRAVTYAIQPAFKRAYRIAWLIFCWAIAAVVLTAYAKLLGDLVPVGGTYREYLICGGQLFFQGAVILLIDRKKTWNYLGNMMTISMGGALLLVPMLLVSKMLVVNELVYLAMFLAVAGLMLLEHVRRMKLLGLGVAPSITWVMYRLIVLGWIFYLQ